MAAEAAKKLRLRTSAAKAATVNKALNAALEALLHPKPEFFPQLLKPCPPAAVRAMLAKVCM
jgi:hypothetical protein